MTNLAMYIQKQIKDLKNDRAANGGIISASKKSAIITSYKQAGIMTSGGQIRKEFR